MAKNSVLDVNGCPTMPNLPLPIAVIIKALCVSMTPLNTCTQQLPRLLYYIAYISLVNDVEYDSPLDFQ